MPEDTNGHAVVVKDLTRRFGSFIAVNQVSLQIPKGEIFGFLGPNGAGKSTTIRMLCGILAPTSGSGTVGGFDVGTEAEKIKASIGYMSQKFSLYEDLTVEENIDFYSGIYRVPAEKKAERKDWVITMADLQDHHQARTATLSGGWKQRLALGCAILHEPSILFLDEPTSGVDPISRRKFWNLINDLSSRGVTIFVTTHYMDEAEYCDRIGLIYRGKLIALGTPETLKHEVMQESILEVFCQDPQDMMDAISGLPGVKDVALFGKGLHIVTINPNVTTPAVHDYLSQKEGRPVAVEEIVPSLEDVFVSLIEEHDRKEEGKQ